MPRLDTSMLLPAVAERCAEIGQAWGWQEFELAMDEGRKRVDWTRGAYCGEYPDYLHTDEQEQVLDDAAKQAWDECWDSRSTVELPPDPEGKNDERAGWGGMAIDQIQATTGCERRKALADLLCDLRHWADREKVDWEDELGRAMDCYAEETEVGPVLTPAERTARTLREIMAMASGGVK